jgi:pimeloyl-ACP methyl ester carboxylesterase
MSIRFWPATSKVGQVRAASRALVALPLVCALLATACTGDDARDGTGNDAGGELPEAVERAGQVSWQPCPQERGEALERFGLTDEEIDQATAHMTYECATLVVPRDWDDPDGDTFEIALLRARHTSPRDRIGSLVVNPGGPGGSGVDLAVLLSLPLLLPARLTQRFDIVGFDPRGVKRSSPVRCFSDADLDASFGADPDPVEQAAFEDLLEHSRRMAQGCQQEYGAALDHYSTHQTARDMEAVRAAVGDEQLTYLGFSYGTRLGAVYAHLFPDRVRAMVLDGAVDPAEPRLEASRGQAEGFERALDNFTGWCTQSPHVCPLRPDARTAIAAAIDDARRSPAVGPDGRRATPGWVFYAMVAALYSQETWEPLAAAMDQLGGGDPTGVFDLADSYAERSPDGEYTNLFDANTAINCADDDSTITVEQVRDLQAQWRQEYPMFGAPLAAGLIGCELWPAEPDPHPVGEATGAAPILVVGTTGDPATPYESAAQLAKVLGVGVLLTWVGEGHTAYPCDECVNRTVEAYLIDLDVPPDGTTCE